MDGTVRFRSVVWFATAIVLAVAATLLVTQAWSADAAPGDSDSTFVPTGGCRLTDTRMAPSTVGSRSTPLGAGDIFEVTVHGANGDCTGDLSIPNDAVGVALNVTAVNATAASNIRIYPADLTDVPLVSNLNVTAGAPPTPNKVDVKLSPDGKIRVFNFRGNVNVFIDIVGYYTNSTLQDLSRRIAAFDTAQSFAVSSPVVSGDVASTDEVVVSVVVTAPSSGQVTVNSTTNVNNGTAGDRTRCSITTGTTHDADYLQQWESPGGAGSSSQLAGTRTFDIAADATATYNLVCDHDGLQGVSLVNNTVLTAIYTPTH